MAILIDTSLWVDFTRSRSPQPLKQLIARYILHADAHLAEPIIFETLHHATAAESKLLNAQFATIPTLDTPDNLWQLATDLGQTCRQKGVNAGSLDLLIAVIAAHHHAHLVTFDADFQKIAALSTLKVKLLTRPIP